VRQSPRQHQAVERWPVDPLRGSTPRCDPDSVARAKAQLAAADRAAPARGDQRPAQLGPILTLGRKWAESMPLSALADKTYHAECLRRWLKQRKIRTAIASTASRRDTRSLAPPSSAG
jgi:hypothetical protein